MQLYETQADDEIDRRRKMIVNAPETKEELTKEEELVMELEKLKEVTDNFDEKVKAINLIANIRHKNKALQKNDNPVRFFVPQRCNSIDCPLYRAEEKRLKEEGKLKY